MAQADQRCQRCGITYPARLVSRAFRQFTRPSGDGYIYHICRPCEQTAHDNAKQADRFAAKARDALRRHAARLGITKADLTARYGWEVGHMAEEARQTYAGSCPYCFAAFDLMGHGLQDLTLDIVDRTQPPYYRTNTRWVCQTCNRAKGSLAPADFEADREVYALWEIGRRATAEDRGLLFDLGEIPPLNA
jgi:hypothetical protein